ncbi:MAG TPA: 50S ribosomal protein L25 [bacterium]|jgi:large subunit ribosomal protein L25
MAETRVSAQPRDPNKGTGKALRRSGFVPAVYYNRDGVVRCLQFERNTLNNLLRKEIGLLKVEVDGESLDCIIREVQRHPVRRDIVHLDLMGIVKGQKITARVPVHIVGIAAGIKDGGTLELVFRDLQIECEPANLPTHLDIDVTALHMNEGFRVSDLHYEGISVIGDPSATVVHVIPPRTEVEGAAAATPGAAEPEVIREKKVEGAEESKTEKKK